MKIKQLSIHNVTSFRDPVDLKLSNSLNLLVGPNAGGKSNLLDILTLTMRVLLRGYKSVPEHHRGRVSREIQPSSNIDLKRNLDTFIGSGTDSKIQITFSLEASDLDNLERVADQLPSIQSALRDYSNGSQFNLSFLDGSRLSELSEDSEVTYRIINLDLETPQDDSPTRIFFEYLKHFELLSYLDSRHNLGLDLSSCYYYIPPTRNFGGTDALTVNLSEQSYRDFLEGTIGATSRRGGGSYVQAAVAYLAAKHRDLEAQPSSIGYKELWDNDEEVGLLRENLRRIEYDWELSIEDRTSNTYRSVLKYRGDEYDVGRASSGEQELLNFIFTTFGRRLSSGVLVVEVPELHLHYQWQRVLLDLFFQLSAKTKNQIIASTHSADFITPKSLPFVIRIHKDDAGVSRVVDSVDLSSTDPRALFHMINAHNNQKMFFSDLVVLVEGWTDRLLVEKFLELSLNVVGDTRVIEVLEVQGKNNFPRYREFLQSIQVPCLIIADRDYVVGLGNQEIDGLFEVDFKGIEDKVLKSKKSKDLSSLSELIEQALAKDDLGDVRILWEYIKDRHQKLKPNLTEDEKVLLEQFIDGRRECREIILTLDGS